MRRVPIDPLEISHFFPYSQLFSSIFAEVPAIVEISLVPSKESKKVFLVSLKYLALKNVKCGVAKAG